jgi:hypothetical protein
MLTKLRWRVAGVLLFSASPAVAYTQQEAEACIGDAFKFCSSAIPNQERVKSCLIQNVARLGSGCQRFFGPLFAGTTRVPGKQSL